VTTGLVVSFGTLVGLGLPSVQGSLLARADFAGLIYLAVIGKCHASLNLPRPGIPLSSPLPSPLACLPLRVLVL
jgi:hypothetical protein